MSALLDRKMAVRRAVLEVDREAWFEIQTSQVDQEDWFKASHVTFESVARARKHLKKMLSQHNPMGFEYRIVKVVTTQYLAWESE